MKNSAKKAVLVLLAMVVCSILLTACDADPEPVEPTQPVADPPAVMIEPVHTHPEGEECDCEISVGFFDEEAPPDVGTDSIPETKPARPVAPAEPVNPGQTVNPPDDPENNPVVTPGPGENQDPVTDPVLPPIDIGEDIEPVKPDFSGNDDCPPLPELDNPDVDIDDYLDISKPDYAPDASSGNTQPENAYLPNDAVDSEAGFED